MKVQQKIDEKQNREATNVKAKMRDSATAIVSKKSIRLGLGNAQIQTQKTTTSRASQGSAEKDSVNRASTKRSAFSKRGSGGMTFDEDHVLDPTRLLKNTGFHR